MISKWTFKNIHTIPSFRLSQIIDCVWYSLPLGIHAQGIHGTKWPNDRNWFLKVLSKKFVIYK